MNETSPKTAIIAGQGGLPAVLVAALQATSTPCLVAEMEGFPATAPGASPIRFRIERLVPLLEHLEKEGVRRVCFAGAVSRPKIEPEFFDPRTATLVPRLLAAIQAGDDGALRTIIAIFEEWDFTVVGAHEIAPDILPPKGVLTSAGPLVQHEADAELGEGVVEKMGREDTGQACIVSGRHVVAREGPEGTDAMMRALLPTTVDRKLLPGDPFEALIGWAVDTVSNIGASPVRSPAQEGGILFKAPKPEQDRRIDLPTIGPDTAMLAAECGLAGIVIEAGGVIVLDQDKVREILNGFGMFLWVRPHGFRR